MAGTAETLAELLRSPTESLAVELKGWFDPSTPQGESKIAKACIALRNANGGYLVIGFDDKTGAPVTDDSRPNDVRQSFHPDIIQSIASKYASDPFEAQVHFVARDGAEYPVVEVRPGFKLPVAARKALQDPTNSGDLLVRQHQIYVRSISASGVVSTSALRYQDIERLIELCFDNREADIGRFVRRHLTDLEPSARSTVEGVLARAAAPGPTHTDLAMRLLDEGSSRFDELVSERSPSLPEHGALEFAAVLHGDVPAHSADRDFLNLLSSSNPQLTGWALWEDFRALQDTAERPFVYNNGWEALVVWIGRGFTDSLDFWRVEPSGRFYHRRALADDMAESSGGPPPMKFLDFGIAVLRVTEALAVVKSFAQSLGCDKEQVSFTCGCRWSKLKGRELSSWANHARHMRRGQIATQDEVVSSTEVPLDTPSSALYQHVHEVVSPLFLVFNGMTVSEGIVEELASKLLERK